MMGNRLLIGVGSIVAVLSGGASAQVSSDGALAAINGASPNACAPDRVHSDAHSQGFGPQKDVTIAELDSVPLKGDPARQVRLVRVTVAPGGVIGWHEHASNQGMALLVSGSAVEVRKDCRDFLSHRPGAIIKEYATTVHGFRNDGKIPAVFLVTHGLPAE
jgi:quercetin dioxygenase-like cupin family protein